ncbi:hypothetical protein SmJEL517_g05766 [Synchytrium microbalum]|uniref:Sas10 C-terminal domain-containing protein n=1 Tax=Synchytrium microbalum TaxID=1806994 RepID=A0A507BUS8_9FUNG|nr:uncharacterized protein SmJEL517_g05766 [Synchytrium microbalum]TPX30739.1 hypothetical protein SmJEL517_g05766 [Synchytrium microbalum]
MSIENKSTVEEDAPAAIKVMTELQEKAKEVMGRVNTLRERLSDLPTSKGVSLLTVKFHTLLSYLTHITFYTLLRTQGHKIESHPTIDSLIELRTVLEKIRPMELKLKYQVDKLVKAAVNADEVGIAAQTQQNVQVDTMDPLMYRPNPGALMGDEAEDDVAGHNNSSNNTQQRDSTGLYKPPRVAPMPYTDSSSTTANKQTKLTAQAKEKAARSRIIRDLRSQFDDRPEETSTEGTGYSRKDGMTDWDKSWDEREKFEEDHFIRLNLTKKDKWHRKELQKTGGMGRFQDEFENLDTDFASLTSVKKAVDASDADTYGRGLLGRKNKRVAAAMMHGDDNDDGDSGQKKPRFKDVDSLISSASKDQDRGGRFEKRVKRFVRPKRGGGRK